MQPFSAQIIVISDRAVSGERPAKSSFLAERLVSEAGGTLAATQTVGEDIKSIEAACAHALAGGADLILTIGATGVSAGNYAPEVTTRLAPYRLFGLETQVLIEGLKSTPKAGLSRGIIAMTALGKEGQLMANLPSSSGGVKDWLGVLLPLVPNLLEDRI